MRKKYRTKILLVVFILSAVTYYVWTFQINSNFREVVKGKIYRSGQPRLNQLRSWIDHYNIKTIINLRGPNADHIDEETQLAKELDACVVSVELSAYKLISNENLDKLINVLETAQQPILIHCNSGVDRSGTVSTLAAWIAGGEDFETAERHMFVPPGPWKRRWFVSPHVSDTVELYEDYCHENKLDPDSIEQFEQWNESVYKPAAAAK